MKTKILALIIFLSTFTGIAQRKITPTESFTITGKIKKEKSFTLAALDSFPKQRIEDRIIYNHKGEVKDTGKNMKGVLLTTLLSKTEFLYDKPKTLNEFYFVCIASDGYKVVFSWNEIYNTDVGNQLYIVTEMEGKKLTDLEQRILLLSSGDLKSGRRYIKALQKIEVRQAE
jgi:hypothetical protein